MKVSNPVNSPFQFLSFHDDKGNTVSVCLPTFVECVYLSSDVRGVKPGPIRNWTQAELLELQHTNSRSVI